MESPPRLLRQQVPVWPANSECFLASTTTVLNRLQGPQPHPLSSLTVGLFHVHTSYLKRHLADFDLDLATITCARGAGQPAHSGCTQPDDVHL